ncbi:MAG: UbiA family prenyltransferase [Hyphomonadaceae bacterium]|nr:UbiA family prenyltransferase [Hyphomonadaceae bacterium]
MSAEATEPGTAELPLAVDLDGTLIHGDTFFESILSYLGSNPLGVIALAGWFTKGRAFVKAKLADYAPKADEIPYDQRLLTWLREEKARGRRLALATATDRRIADAIAAHVGLFDDVFASDGVTNLKSARKAEALSAAYPDGFVYAGNELADLEVWAQAKGAVVVNADSTLQYRAAALTKVERVLPDQRDARKELERALRPRQWVKNILVFIPLIAAQGWADIEGWKSAFLAFAALCCAASSVYLFNDALDIPADRRHPRKRNRPFASGALSPARGILVAIGLAFAALLIGWAANVVTLTLAYMALSSLYTVWMKRLVVVDIFVLASLYGLRVLLGGEASVHPASSWMLAFCGFFFLSLALVKRVTEIEGAPENIRRGYRIEDAPILKAMGVGSAFAASLVLALYVQSDAAVFTYDAPMWLWLLPGAVIFWLCRVWLLTGRGEMPDDPVVHAVGDRMSLVMALVAALAYAAAVLF